MYIPVRPLISSSEVVNGNTLAPVQYSIDTLILSEVAYRYEFLKVVCRGGALRSKRMVSIKVLGHEASASRAMS